MALFSNLPSSVKLMEVAPRDGLQNEQKFVDTPSKLAFIDNLVEAGVTRIETTAFVSPKWIPALADHMDVACSLKPKEGVSYAALVPNLLGYERALKSNITEIAFLLSASETHNSKNINNSIEQSLANYRELSLRAKRDGIPFRVYLSCSFGCPYEGKVDISKVVSLAQKIMELEPYELVLGDTIGISSPNKTAETLDELIPKVGKDKLALHMHDTQGMALANILTALQMGISSFDSAAGGLGGCPYAKGATGNVASEDLVNMLHSMNIETGVNLKKLCYASSKIGKVLSKPLSSKVFNSVMACGSRCEK